METKRQGNDVVVVVSAMGDTTDELLDLMTGARAWVVLAEGGEASVDDAVARQRRYDPDLWVIEVEDPKGRHLLDSEGLAD